MIDTKAFLCKSYSGDIWECLRVAVMEHWGKQSDPGSLCNLRSLINHTLVDKAAQTFSIADEFVVHAFKVHLLAAICTHVNMPFVLKPVEHESPLEWLSSTAKSVMEKHVMPKESNDPIHALHRSFPYVGFLYMDLRKAIRYEEGAHIIRLWKHWAILFLGTDCNNYSTEAYNLLCNLQVSYPKHIAYLVTHNRTVNMHGMSGRGKPIDQMLEHYNL